MPQGHAVSLVFSLFSCFPYLSFHQSLQQRSLKYSLKFWNWAEAIKSGCAADRGGHLMELAQSLVFFGHCCCPMALWLLAMELPQCGRVWANELLICNSNSASASEERKRNPQSYLFVQWSSYWRTRAVGSPYGTEWDSKERKRNNFKERFGGERGKNLVIHCLYSGVIPWPPLFIMPENIFSYQSLPSFLPPLQCLCWTPGLWSILFFLFFRLCLLNTNLY